MAATSPHEQHEVVFKWPHTEPKHVTLTGSFDDWKKSINLTKTQAGFEARIRLPYNEKTPYKFIVDGTWLVDESNPTAYDTIGNLNNIYTPPPQPPATKLTPPTTPVVIGGFDTSKEVASPGKATDRTNGGANIGYFPKVEGGDDKNKSASRLSLSDFANTVAARDGITSAYEYVKSGLGAVIGGVVGVDPINAGQIALPTPNTATSFDTQIPQPVTPAPAPEMAPNVPIGIVPVNSTEHNTIAAENGDAKPANGGIHTHSPIVNPVKDKSGPALASPAPTKEAETAPEIPVIILPLADKETVEPAAPLPETTTVPEPAPVAPVVESAAPASTQTEDKKVEEALADLAISEPTAAPVSKELLDKAVPTPLGPIVPPKEEKETVPAPAPVAAPIEKAAPAPTPAAETKPEEKVEQPSTPPPGAAAPAAAAPSTPSKPPTAPTASAPSTPQSVQKGSSGGSHFKRGSIGGTFGSIRGKKEGKDKKGEDTSSSSGSSVSGDAVGKDGKKKKKKESILHKIKRVLTPHHHDHHHHEHHQENGEKKEETKV